MLFLLKNFDRGNNFLQPLLPSLSSTFQVQVLGLAGGVTLERSHGKLPRHLTVTYRAFPALGDCASCLITGLTKMYCGHYAVTL